MISFFVALGLLGQDPGALAGPPVPTKVVVTVNGHPITAKEIQAYLWDWDAPQVGQVLTIFELIRQEAEKQGVVASPADVKQKVDAQITQMMASAQAKTSRAQFIKDRHVPVSQIVLGARAQILVDKIAEKSFKPADFVRVETIVVRAKSQAADDLQAAITKGNAAYAALQKGDAWEKVLPAFASDPQTIQNNGEIGWIPVTEFPTPARAELGTLKVGGYTKPVQTPNGIQIFKLEARGKDVTPAELEQVKQRYVHSAESDIVQKLRQNAKITDSY
jgi:parvulin-like peptidyl-prolyl isomerase